MYCCRELKKTEYLSALQLAIKVFMEYEAPDYSAEGIETFRQLMSDNDYIAEIRCYGAFDAETNNLVGMIATRQEGKHITLFFVDGKHHRRGVGKELMQLVICDNKNGKLTVNSSPYAVDVYKKLGFSPTGPEEVADGIRFTPMEMINRVKFLQETECIDYTSTVIQTEAKRLQEHSCSQYGVHRGTKSMDPLGCQGE